MIDCFKARRTLDAGLCRYAAMPLCRADYAWNATFPPKVGFGGQRFHGPYISVHRDRAVHRPGHNVCQAGSLALFAHVDVNAKTLQGAHPCTHTHTHMVSHTHSHSAQPVTQCKRTGACVGNARAQPCACHMSKHAWGQAKGCKGEGLQGRRRRLVPTSRPGHSWGPGGGMRHRFVPVGFTICRHGIVPVEFAICRHGIVPVGWPPHMGVA